MRNNFSKKTARVAIAEPSQSVRQAIADALKRLGFLNVMPLPSLVEVWDQLATDSVDWIITSLFPNAEVNALQILQVCTEQEPLFRVRISLLLQPDEMVHLPSAFSLGLLSWHRMISSNESAKHEFARLSILLETMDWDECLVAAEFLWEWLSSQNKIEQMQSLQNILTHLYPANTQCLMRLGEAYLRRGDFDIGRKVMAQVGILNPKLLPQTSQILRKFLGDSLENTSVESQSGVLSSILGFNRAVIVDADESVRKQLKKVLLDLGAHFVQEFSDGESAQNWIASQNDGIDLVVMEWVLPKRSSLCLLQRVGEHFASGTPVVVISSKIGIEDLAALRELGVADFRAKPIESAEFIVTISRVARELRNPTDFEFARRSILNHLHRGERNDAATIRRGVQTSGLGGEEILLDAEMAFIEGNFIAARDLAAKALLRGCDSLRVLSLIGKSLVKLRDFVGAAVFLEKAQAISSSSMVRLCLLAESYCEIGEDAKAVGTLDEATRLDGDHPSVAIAGVRVHLAGGREQEARTALTKLPSFEEMISFINNRAISLALTQRVDEGIELYERGLRILPEETSDARATLIYNLSLAYLRNDKPEKAIFQLEQYKLGSSAAMQERIIGLKETLLSARQLGRKIRISNTEETCGLVEGSAKSPSETGEKVNHYDLGVAVTLRRGDLRCFKIYLPDEKDLEISKPLLSKRLTFIPRETVVKRSMTS